MYFQCCEFKKDVNLDAITKMDLLEQILSEPFFDNLRTKKQVRVPHNSVFKVYQIHLQYINTYSTYLQYTYTYSIHTYIHTYINTYAYTYYIPI